MPGFRRRLLAVILAVIVAGAAMRALAAGTLPARLTDREFWTLVSDFSEPDGHFHSDNLLSNEIRFQHVLPTLTATTRTGQAYLGVGPEQNFTFIAAMKPAMVFIVDVRRGNLDLHLMYKALFELSSDRADFTSRLFSRKRPLGLRRDATVGDMFTAFAAAPPSQAMFDANLKAVLRLLTVKHGWALSEGDREGIEYVLHAFFVLGPDIRYSPTGAYGGTVQPTYADVMTATDANGRARSFLASDEAFTFMKTLEIRNLLVPVVGNFAGPKAIRAVGRYLAAHDATVSAFYVSNVEEYLVQDRIRPEFCANVSTLPLDRTSTFIRSTRDVTADGDDFDMQLGPILDDIQSCR